MIRPFCFLARIWMKENFMSDCQWTAVYYFTVVWRGLHPEADSLEVCTKSAWDPLWTWRNVALENHQYPETFLVNEPQSQQDCMSPDVWIHPYKVLHWEKKKNQKETQETVLTKAWSSFSKDMHAAALVSKSASMLSTVFSKMKPAASCSLFCVMTATCQSKKEAYSWIPVGATL